MYTSHELMSTLGDWKEVWCGEGRGGRCGIWGRKVEGEGEIGHDVVCMYVREGMGDGVCVRR